MKRNLLACLLMAGTLPMLRAADAPDTPNSSESSASSNVSDWRSSFQRWLTLNEFSSSARYRSVLDSNNVHEFNQGQHREVVDGTFKADREGRYGVTFHLSSGDYFNWSYANFTGGGAYEAYQAALTRATPSQIGNMTFVNAFDPSYVNGQRSSGGWGMHMRRLYGFAEPIRGIQVQFGSLDINRGVASEITTYDYDGYVTGERVSVKRPQNLYFDEISATFGYLGDIYTTSFFSRGERLLEHNYTQALVAKSWAKRVKFSFDFTRQDGNDTFHEAAQADTHESRIADSVLVETYQRPFVGFLEFPFHVPLDGGNGWAVTVNKKVRRLSVQAGYASVDIHQPVLALYDVAAILCLGLNGDTYGAGDRVFAKAAYRVAPFVEMNAFFTHQLRETQNFDPSALVWNRQAMNFGVTVDWKKLLFPNREAN